MFRLGNCDTTNWIDLFEEKGRNQIKILTLTGNIFTGGYIIPGPDPDPTLTGTLNDGCTGSFDDFGIFAGTQPFIYNADTCSIIFLNTGNVFRSKRTECTGLTPGNINIISEGEPYKIKKCSLTVVGIF